MNDEKIELKAAAIWAYFPPIQPHSVGRSDEDPSFKKTYSMELPWSDNLDFSGIPDPPTGCRPILLKPTLAGSFHPGYSSP